MPHGCADFSSVNGGIMGKPNQLMVEEGYESLFKVFEESLNQAQSGKGKGRHTDGSGTPFEDQQICIIPRMQRTVNGPLFQSIKKCLEINNIHDIEMKIKELHGAINYIAAAVIILEEQKEKNER